ncbi:MAG: FAD-dependent oxidoreductase, partial [Carbonactinosporaceae bacterium]
MNGPVNDVVVVGGGLAGLRSVQELREQGYGGRLTLLGAEPHRPYDRPPLSKALLLGEADDSTLEADWPALDVQLRLGCRVTGLRGAGSRDAAVETDQGPLRYDGLVIATGARPVPLPVPAGQPGSTAGVHLLRTVDQA